MRPLASALLLGFFSVPYLWAESTLVLKNGRRIVVQSYREEGGMVKFQGLGGEIGIAKDQVRTILKDGEADSADFIVPKRDDLAEAAGAERPPVSPAPEKTGAGPQDIPPADRSAQEARDYQIQLRALTEEIESLKRRYVLAARGYGSEGQAPDSNEVLKAWTLEFSSRLKDSVKQPAAGYTAKEKELSDLREQIQSLEKKRERLLQEMNYRGLDGNAGSGGSNQAR
jgi:hypothetical protein